MSTRVLITTRQLGPGAARSQPTPTGPPVPWAVAIPAGGHLRLDPSAGPGLD